MYPYLRTNIYCHAIQLNNYRLVDWSLVRGETRCQGAYNPMGQKNSVAECSTSCYGRTSMFSYGSDYEYEHDSCRNFGKCNCRCEIGGRKDGSCDMNYSQHFTLYKYTNPYPGKKNTV